MIDLAFRRGSFSRQPPHTPVLYFSQSSLAVGDWEDLDVGLFASAIVFFTRRSFSQDWLAVRHWFRFLWEWDVQRTIVWATFESNLISCSHFFAETIRSTDAACSCVKSRYLLENGKKKKKGQARTCPLDIHFDQGLMILRILHCFFCFCFFVFFLFFSCYVAPSTTFFGH